MRLPRASTGLSLFPRGKIECTIFGDFVDQLKAFMSINSLTPVVVVLQYAKVKIFKGSPVVQNSMYASRMLLNPDINEATEFRSKMLAGGLQLSACSSVVVGTPKVSIEDEYLKLYPEKTIESVNSSPEDVVVIVLATINEIVDDGQWWYPSCKCHKAVVADNGVYYCHSCSRHVFNVTPRYKLQIEVSDLTGCAILILFDYDVYYLVRKTCADMLASIPQGTKSVEYPLDFKSLIDRKLLFKVANTTVSSPDHSGIYRVCGVCDDPNIIAMYEFPGVDISPNKVAYFFGGISACPSQIAGYAKEVAMTAVSLGDDVLLLENADPMLNVLLVIYLMKHPHERMLPTRSL
ncbi:hypothetical protein RIF29_04642 [Crotalaria pallida]|uniref:Replication factor A C-terminal domain-containing protein n=1 Tax=Crotalaria pallida TaxID=3830 RepID=A0AAN9J3Q7_CROPI